MVSANEQAANGQTANSQNSNGQKIVSVDWIEQGAALLGKGRPKAALECFKTAAGFAPDNPLAYYNAGVACHALGEIDNAIAWYQRAIAIDPGLPEAYYNLGQAYMSKNRILEGVAAFRFALSKDREHYASAYSLGLAYRRMGRLSDAAKAIQTAVQINPGAANAFSTLGLIFSEQHRFDESKVCLEQALLINPKHTEAHYNLGALLQKNGHFERGLLEYDKALACYPQYAQALWLRMLSLPMIYDHSDQIEPVRRQFERNLDRLIQTTPLVTHQHKTYALQGVQSTTNFYLQYQGYNDIDLQARYGRFVQDIMSANFPGWSKKKVMPPCGSNQKIRIGYVSAFMHHHTVGVFLSGWLKGHTREAFDIHCYHVGNTVDPITRQINDRCGTFKQLTGDIASIASQIDADDLHILVYMDIGMEPGTTQLAAMRLAPVQCCWWGHPVTTGLATIDYFLTSDLMEPSNADSHYSEQLVRLPNLSLYYHSPKLPKRPKGREALGLPKDRFIFLSSQSIFKYLPQHDDIYPRIANLIPNSCFVFISHPSDDVTRRFKKRLMTSFAAIGLDAQRYCYFCPRLSVQDFLSLNMASDVFLDTLEWSGGKTTLEALSCDLPVITLPGRFMRGRHAYAMLKRIGAMSGVARSKSNYCQLAVRLARHPAFLADLKSQISANKHRLYGDRDFIRSLESFYQSVVRSTLPQRGIQHAHGHIVN